MQESFDPYHEWLDFPQGKNPANHYELLGIPAFESDPEVISHAADCLRGQIRSIRPGPNLAAWQRLLDRINEAKACLTDPQSKGTYDAGLRNPAPAPAQSPPAGNPPMAAPPTASGVPMATPPGMAAPPGGMPAAQPPNPASPGGWTAPPQPATPADPQHGAGYGAPAAWPPAGSSYPPVPGQYPPVPQQHPPVPEQPAPASQHYPPVPGQYPPAPQQYPPAPQQPPPTGQMAAGPSPVYPSGNVPFGQFPGSGYPPVPQGDGPLPAGTALPQGTAVPMGRTTYGSAAPSDAPASPYGGGPTFVAAGAAGGAGRQPAPQPRSGSPLKAVATVVLLLAAGGLGYVLYQVVFNKPNEVATGNPGPPELKPEPPGGNPKPADPKPGPPEKPEPKPVDQPPEKPEPKPVEKPDPPEMPEPKPVDKPAPPEKPEPQPVEKPKPPAVDPAKQAAFGRAVAQARISLTEHDTAAAQTHLNTAGANAQTPEQQAEVQRVRMLADLLEQFWNGISQASSALEGAEELVVGDTRVAVVEASAQQLILFVAGKHQTYKIKDLPSSLVATLANRWFAKEPKSKVFLAAYQAVDPKGDRQRARRYWKEAAAAGVDIGDLEAELDKFEHLETPPVGGVPTTSAVPNDAERIRQAEKLVRETYGKEFNEAKLALDKVQLARRLIDDAAGTDDEPEARYVMIREARDLAVGCGQPKLACDAVDAMARYFSIDPLAQKRDALVAAAGNAKGLSDHAEAARLAMELARAAVDAKQLDDAAKLAALGVDEAKKARSAPLTKAAMDIEKLVQGVKGG